MGVVSKEVAEVEFDRFIDCMDIDLGDSELDEEERGNLKQLKVTIIKAVCSGVATVNEDGEVTIEPRKGDIKPLTFHEPTGAALMAFDKKKPGEDVGKMFAAMAVMTKVPASTFSKMRNSDLKICMAIFNLFFG